MYQRFFLVNSLYTITTIAIANKKCIKLPPIPDTIPNSQSNTMIIIIVSNIPITDFVHDKIGGYLRTRIPRRVPPEV